ncbi:MAG: hypothetical protein PVF43_15435 [Candidatus Eiseniibacteriota bacterium]
MGSGASGKGDVSLQISIIRPVEQSGDAPLALPRVAQVRTLSVLVFDVTGNPAQPASALGSGTLFSFEIPEGAASIEGTIVLSPDSEGSDYRFRAELDEDGVTFVGTRTLSGVRRGDRLVADIPLVPPPPATDNAIRIGNSTTERGDPSHLVPIVLANDRPAGGFQFDMTVDPALVSDVLGFEIDPASRLGTLGGSLSARFNRVSASPTEHVWRIIVASTDARRPIVAGQDVLCFVETQIGVDATTDSIRVSNAVIADTLGVAMIPDQQSGTIRIVEGP